MGLGRRLTPKQGVGPAHGGGCSRQAVVGIQTFRLHIVNCNRGKRVGGEARGLCSCGEVGWEVVPQGAGLPGELRTSQPFSCPSGSLTCPLEVLGGWTTSAATHTGSCRGCWSPSWIAGWSGHPSGDPLCAQRGSGTSYFHCPWNRSCRAEDKKRWG